MNHKTYKQKRIEKMKSADYVNLAASTKTHRTQSRYYYQQYAATWLTGGRTDLHQQRPQQQRH